MVIRKRCLLWDYKNTTNPAIAAKLQTIDFNNGPFHSVSNWNSWTPPELGQSAPFRPMYRDINISHGDWKMIQDSPEPIVHYLNEPERQPGCTPQRAAEVWEERMVPLCARGKKLVSPSVASDDAGQEWLYVFMSLPGVKAHPPDYLGLHWYGMDAEEAKQYISGKYAKYNLPVIVSELASTSRDEDAVVRFTVEMANWMDETSWVAEYGFFGAMPEKADDFVSGQAQLMNQDGSWTPLMKKLLAEQPMEA